MISIYFNTDIPYHYYSTIKLSNSKKKHDIIIIPISAWMKKALLFWIYPYFIIIIIIMIKKTQKCLFIAFSHSVFSPVHFSSVVFWLRETAVIPNHQIHIYCYIYLYYYYYYYYTYYTSAKSFYFPHPKKMANML